MYDIDRYRNQHHLIPYQAAGGKRSRVQPSGTSPVFELSFDAVEAHGIKLAHRDVTRNLKPDNCCEECGLSQFLANGIVDKKIRGCDAGYPKNIGYASPYGGNGGHHLCHRGGICDRCILKEPDLRTGGWSLRHKGLPVLHLRFQELLKKKGARDSNIFFVCSECTKGTSEYLDVWSDGSEEAKYYLRPGCVHPTSAPVPEPVNETAYAIRHDVAAASRAERSVDGAARYARYGGEVAVRAARTFVRVVRGFFMPATQQRAVLSVVNQLFNEGVVRAAAQSADGDIFGAQECPLPLDLRTVNARAAFDMLSGDDIKVKKVAIGLHNLSQQQQECHVLINDLEECLQSLLLDPRFPAKQRYFRTAEERGQYTTEDGEQVHGPECWHGEQWQDCEDTIPAGSRLLYIIVHSDETKSLRGSRYPFRLQIGNFAYGGRCKDFGNRLIGLGPLINIHRQRGSKAHIDLNDDQFACKANVYSLTPALILSDLNEVAKHVSTFNLWYPDGARRISVVVRVGIWSADFEEKKSLLGFTGGGCPRCRYYEHAVQAEEDEGKEPRTKERPQMDETTAFPCMRHTPRSLCEFADKRTLEYVVSKQVRLLYVTTSQPPHRHTPPPPAPGPRPSPLPPDVYLGGARCDA